MYLKYWDPNNLYGWAMSQKLPVGSFEFVEVASQDNENFIKNYEENSDVGYFFEVDIHYPKKLNDLHNDFQFLPERMKVSKIEKLVGKLHDKNIY